MLPKHSYKGKKINYAALNVTKLFKKSAATENPRRLSKQFLLDKTLNAICYVKINDLVFAKRGQDQKVCQVKAVNHCELFL